MAKQQIVNTGQVDPGVRQSITGQANRALTRQQQGRSRAFQGIQQQQQQAFQSEQAQQGREFERETGQLQRAFQEDMFEKQKAAQLEQRRQDQKYTQDMLNIKHNLNKEMLDYEEQLQIARTQDNRGYVDDIIDKQTKARYKRAFFERANTLQSEIMFIKTMKQYQDKADERQKLRDGLEDARDAFSKSSEAAASMMGNATEKAKLYSSVAMSPENKSYNDFFTKEVKFNLKQLDGADGKKTASLLESQEAGDLASILASLKGLKKGYKQQAENKDLYKRGYTYGKTMQKDVSKPFGLVGNKSQKNAQMNGMLAGRMDYYEDKIETAIANSDNPKLKSKLVQAKKWITGDGAPAKVQELQEKLEGLAEPQQNQILDDTLETKAEQLRQLKLMAESGEDLTLEEMREAYKLNIGAGLGGLD